MRRGRSVLLLGALLCAGCGPAPQASSGAATASRPPLPSPVRSPSPSPYVPPSPLPVSARPSVSTGPSFPDGFAVSCAGYPQASRVIALMRSKQVISRSASVVASVGPLCAGSWQYTVLNEPNREPLQVITQGRPTSLQLVTAGTDVCTPLVRTQAPPGILTVAHC
jgi:hypothetical protein